MNVSYFIHQYLIASNVNVVYNTNYLVVVLHALFQLYNCFLLPVFYCCVIICQLLLIYLWTWNMLVAFVICILLRLI